MPNVLEFIRPTPVKVRSVDGRKEFHGEAKVLAIDLSFLVKTNATILDQIDLRLRPFLFSDIPWEEEIKKFDQQRIIAPQNDLPYVRFPHLQYPLKLDYEWIGHTLRLDYGRGGDTDKILNLCKVKSIQITPVDEGSIEMQFSVSSAADITGDMIGIFSELIQLETSITLFASKDEPKQAVIDASKDGDAPGNGAAAAPAADAPKDATGEFLARNLAPEGGDGVTATH